MPRSLLVEVPDAFAGRLLVERLGPAALCAQVEGVHGDLWLALDPAAPGVAAVLEVVRQWLDETHVRAARVRHGGREWLVEA